MHTGQHVVFLKEKDGQRYLPIWIGPFEANSIALRITGVNSDRPITHDLIASTFGEFGISVTQIVVTSLSDEVYYARLHLHQNGHEVDIDSRPSDAIALAVRFECPIFVAPEVIDRAGIIPDKDDEKEESQLDEDRLAVFRDIINNLDLPDLPDEPGGKNSPGSG
jgi:bifunctional DNase/RNase